MKTSASQFGHLVSAAIDVVDGQEIHRSIGRGFFSEPQSQAKSMMYAVKKKLGKEIPKVN